MSRFFKVQLRTSDVAGARAFYGEVLPALETSAVQLHEQAVARGARPHWLGFVEVDDVERTLAAFVERGATPLGPKWVNPEGLEARTMRDPGGAVLALGKPPADSVAGDGTRDGAIAAVDWFLLHTPEVERAKKNYADLFGWQFEGLVDLGPLGRFHPFAWEAGAQAVGSMSDLAAHPERHPHWHFHFDVHDLDAAVHRVKAHGGTVVATVDLPSGDRVAACDDPQGAAFGLRQRAPKEP